MPQLDISTFPSQIFWLIICFAVLCFAMASFLAPRIGNSLVNRQRTLIDLSESADKILIEADILERQNQIDHKAALYDINQRIHQALTEQKQKKDVQLFEFEQIVQDKLNSVHEKLNTQKNELLKNADQLLTHLSCEAYAHLTGRSIEENLVAQSVSLVGKSPQKIINRKGVTK
jgi:F-type H+-transporting ATPase subunit b